MYIIFIRFNNPAGIEFFIANTLHTVVKILPAPRFPHLRVIVTVISRPLKTPLKPPIKILTTYRRFAIIPLINLLLTR